MVKQSPLLPVTFKFWALHSFDNESFCLCGVNEAQSLHPNFAKSGKGGWHWFGAREIVHKCACMHMSSNWVTQVRWLDVAVGWGWETGWLMSSSPKYARSTMAPTSPHKRIFWLCSPRTEIYTSHCTVCKGLGCDQSHRRPISFVDCSVFRRRLNKMCRQESTATSWRVSHSRRNSPICFCSKWHGSLEQAARRNFFIILASAYFAFFRRDSCSPEDCSKSINKPNYFKANSSGKRTGSI